MADARRFHEIKRIGDAEGATDFAGMNGEAKPCITRNIEGAGIVGHTPHALLAGHVETGDERIVAAGGIFGGGNDALGTEMAFTRDDDARLDAGCGFRSLDARSDAGEIGVGAKADAIAMVGRDDDFAVDRVDGGKFAQIRLGQQRVILFRAKKGGDAVISLDEFGKVVPGIGAVAHEGRRIDAVFLSLRKGQRRRCRTLEMTVQFGLLQSFRHRKLRPWRPGSMPRCAAMVSPISA